MGGTAVRQQERAVARHCGTCSATFATWDALQTHLRDAYHGFQCVHCGALFARRGQMNEHDCQAHQGWMDTLPTRRAGRHAAPADGNGTSACNSSR